MTDQIPWTQSSKTETTHQKSWWVDEKGRLLPPDPDPVTCIARVVAEILVEPAGTVTLKISLDHCRRGGFHGGTAVVPTRLSGGWSNDDPKALSRLFELAQEAAEHAARFYATMVKAWQGTFTEDLKDE
jgi:hypothetical protein